MYGFVERADGDLVCFYDANSVTSPTKLTRVWVKCIFQKELEDYGKQHSDHIRASAERNLARPGEWAQLPAESAGATLADLLCYRGKYDKAAE